MPYTPNQIVEAIREELSEILSGPGVTWNKQGLLAAFDQAVARAVLRLFGGGRD